MYDSTNNINIENNLTKILQMLVMVFPYDQMTIEQQEVLKFLESEIVVSLLRHQYLNHATYNDIKLKAFFSIFAYLLSILKLIVLQFFATLEYNFVFSVVLLFYFSKCFGFFKVPFQYFNLLSASLFTRFIQYF